MDTRTSRLAFAFLLVVAGCTTSTEESTFDNPFDPSNTGAFPVPDSITVLVGNNAVRLGWSLEAGSGADVFAVFRRRIDLPTPEDETLVTKTPARTYEDRQVRNGRVYVYRIAAGNDDQFGARSVEVEARPAFFALILAGDAPRSRSLTVTVTPTAPAGSEAVQLSEFPEFTGAAWRPVTTSMTWVLSGGDGEKTVYGRFRIADGSESLPVSDGILLDTRATILEVDFDGAETRAPGDPIHFRLDAGEPDGVASVTVGTVFSSLPLFDDGTGGDPQAGDGIYERDVVIPAMGVVNQATVTGRFTDAAGNEAASLNGSRSLTVAEAPTPVAITTLDPAVPPDIPAVTIRWTQSLETSFRSYRVHRSEDADVDAGDILVGEVTTASTLEFRDLDVVEGTTYFYRVFVRNTLGLQTGSAIASLTVPNLRPPVPVTLQEPDGVSESRIALGWTKSTSEDFAAYRVHRNMTGAVTEGDTLISEIPDADRLYFDDSGLRENTTYHYRVFTVDEAGLTARSNEVEARTTNLAPPAVILQEAFDVDSTAATLSWLRSEVHDFASYRLYRDTVPTVTAASTLMVELSERDATSFRDLGLSNTSTYYYRVYVVDDGETPEPMQSGSNIVEVSTP